METGWILIAGVVNISKCECCLINVLMMINLPCESIIDKIWTNVMFLLTFWGLFFHCWVWDSTFHMIVLGVFCFEWTRRKNRWWKREWGGQQCSNNETYALGGVRGFARSAKHLGLQPQLPWKSNLIPITPLKSTASTECTANFFILIFGWHKLKIMTVFPARKRS